MMSISPAEATALTWWAYQGLLWNWNDRHTPEGEEEAEAPDPDFVARRMLRIEERGLARSVH
jgi:hypothetical protein